MSRPEPQVLQRHIKDDGVGVIEVCQAQSRGLFVVLFHGQPFQLRSKLNIEVAYPSWKYMRVGFANAAHALRLANKLNAMFSTTEFTVSEMTHGRNIPLK
jgi:hypothetical protein